MAVIEQVVTDTYALYNGDAIQVLPQFPPQSIDMALFSPPFNDIFCYSDHPADLGNCRTYAEFFTHFGFLIRELRRLIKPGRLCVTHCTDLPIMKEREGYIGLRNFSGDIISAFEQQGFIFHSRHTIWKDPLIEATRTKALGLLHKQLQKDSTLSRAGLPDYLLAFRVPGENAVPITHPDGLTTYAGTNDPTKGFRGIEKSHQIWRAYASPVWLDIRQTLTLNAKIARDAQDEKHLCPLQLDTIERALVLWSNPGEVVLDPFSGVGSTLYVAIQNGRRGIGVELKGSYFNQAVKNLRAAQSKQEQVTLFDQHEEEPEAAGSLME